jgi:hypothetical protein
MKTIPIEQLSAYFPYKVKAKFQETNKPTCRKYVIGTVGGIYDNGTIVCHDVVNSYPDRFKLMLRRIEKVECIKTDCILFGEEIRYWEYLELAYYQKNMKYSPDISIPLRRILLKNHVDIFGLIDAGLAEEIKP